MSEQTLREIWSIAFWLLKPKGLWIRGPWLFHKILGKKEVILIFILQTGKH